jgi:osmotically-inducible protein OsmY
MQAFLPTPPMSLSQRLPVADNIAKAIASRAVSGIQVEYDRGTAYLSGRVKTQSQRLAAETAAKKVPGVNTVASSIRVEWQD